MKIAFITTNNPHNKVSRSGIPYSIFSQLKRYNNVEWINPNDYKLYRIGYWIFCVIMLMSKKLGFKITEHNPLMAKLMAITMKRPVLEGKFDAIFMLAQIDAIYMNYGIPIYVRTDAIFESAVNYYWFNIPKWFVRQANKLEDKALDKIECLFAPSHWLADEIIKYHPNKNLSNIKVVMSGANLDDAYIKYPPREYGIDKPIKMLFVGYDLRRKGFDIAYKTMNIIRDSYKIKVTLTVVGGKPSDEQLKDPNLIYIGKMDKNKKEDFDNFYKEFSNANIFIFPTRAEFSAIVNCEAAAYALPIFTYNEGGTSSYVKTNYNGHVFKQNENENDFAKTIVRAIKDGSMKTYSDNSRKMYEQYLNWERWGDYVNSIINKN